MPETPRQDSRGIVAAMDISSPGTSEIWTTLRAGAVDQAVKLAALAAQLESQNAVLALLQEQVAASSGPPPGPGLGAQVDARV